MYYHPSVEEKYNKSNEQVAASAIHTEMMTVVVGLYMTTEKGQSICQS
jgi:hypothetical protein